MHAMQPWLGCSPDGYVDCLQEIIEIKCPVKGKTMTLKQLLPTLPYLDSTFNLKTKNTYYTQIQLSMAVTNTVKCDFIIYSKKDDDCHISTICLDFKYIQKLVDELGCIYFEKMLPYIVNNEM